MDSAVLEELSVRSNMALAQKKVVHELVGAADAEEDFEEKYKTLCALVVSDLLATHVLYGSDQTEIVSHSTLHPHFVFFPGQGYSQALCSHRRCQQIGTCS